MLRILYFEGNDDTSLTTFLRMLRKIVSAFRLRSLVLCPRNWTQNIAPRFDSRRKQSSLLAPSPPNKKRHARRVLVFVIGGRDSKKMEPVTKLGF